MPHPRRRDRQRRALVRGTARQTQIQLALPHGQPLPRHRLQQLQVRVGMRRPDVLDVPRPAVLGVHDLHRPRPGRRLHRPHVRHDHPRQNRPRLVRASRHATAGHRPTNHRINRSWPKSGRNVVISEEGASSDMIYDSGCFAKGPGFCCLLPWWQPRAGVLIRVLSSQPRWPTSMPSAKRPATPRDRASSSSCRRSVRSLM